MKRKLQEAEDVVNEIKRRCRFLAVGCVYNKMRCKQLEDAMGTVEMNFENRKLTIEFVGQRGSRVYRDITPRKRENELRRLCDRVATDVGEPIQPSYSHRVNHMSNRPSAMIAPRTILSFHNEACKKAVQEYIETRELMFHWRDENDRWANVYIRCREFKGCASHLKEAPIKILKECIIHKILEDHPDSDRRRSFALRRRRAEQEFAALYQVRGESAISTSGNPSRIIVRVEHDEVSDLGIIECYIDETLRRCVEENFQSMASQMFSLEHDCRYSNQTLSTIRGSSAAPITIGRDRTAQVSTSRLHEDSIVFNVYDQLVVPSEHYLTSRYEQHIWAYYQSRSAGAFFQLFYMDDYRQKYLLPGEESEASSSTGSRSASSE